ncbi:MAG TPA: aldo/keto reductase [Sphingomonadaceae bacterium]|nr:aldo/keto reductase [Sphingomonadaceae bacterium]
MATPFNTAISRRTILHGSLAAGAGLMIGGWTPALAQDAPLTKPIPSSGERLPVIGIGTNAFGVTDTAEIAARREVLQNLPGLGGKVIDTASAYGRSEDVIGQLLEAIGNRDAMFLATKTPMTGDLAQGKAMLDSSFRRLRTDRIDLLQIHNFHGLDELLPLLAEYKQANKVRYIGITTSMPRQYPQMLAAMAKHRLDFIQVDYSIDSRESADRILPTAQDKGIAVLNNMPFGGRRGSLIPKLAAVPLPDFVKDYGVTSWPQLLLKYNVSHPAITAAIPGTTKLAHLHDNQQAGRGRLFDAATRRRIETHWETLGIS